MEVALIEQSVEYILRARYEDWKKGTSKWKAPAVLSVLQMGFEPTFVELQPNYSMGFANLYVRFNADTDCLDDLHMLLKLREGGMLRKAGGEMSYPGPYYGHKPVKVPKYLRKRYLK